MDLASTDWLGHTTGQGEEEPNPKGNYDHEPGQEHWEAMHDLVVCAVNDAVYNAQQDKEPRAEHEPARNVVCGECSGAKRIEENRDFKQIAEVVCGLHVLKTGCDLQRGRSCLRMNPAYTHFSDAHGKHSQCDRESE